jgi:hypothetical protein
MTKKEWQDMYGFTDDEMEMIVQCVNIFNGSIFSIKERP